MRRAQQYFGLQRRAAQWRRTHVCSCPRDSRGFAQAVDMAAQHGVDVGTFRPHSTHLSQPLDVGCMFKLKDEYGLRVSRWQLEAPAKGIPDVIGTRTALEILAKQNNMKLTAWDVGFSAETTQSAFTKAGFSVVGNFVQVERAAVKKYFGEDGKQMIGARIYVSEWNSHVPDSSAVYHVSEIADCDRLTRFAMLLARAGKAGKDKSAQTALENCDSALRVHAEAVVPLGDATQAAFMNRAEQNMQTATVRRQTQHLVTEAVLHTSEGQLAAKRKAQEEKHAAAAAVAQRKQRRTDAAAAKAAEAAAAAERARALTHFPTRADCARAQQSVTARILDQSGLVLSSQDPELVEGVRVMRADAMLGWVTHAPTTAQAALWAECRQRALARVRALRIKDKRGGANAVVLRAQKQTAARKQKRAARSQRHAQRRELRRQVEPTMYAVLLDRECAAALACTWTATCV